MYIERRERSTSLLTTLFALNPRYAKFKIKVFVHFVTTASSFILNIVSIKLLHLNENKFDFDAFNIQEIKEWGCFFFFLILTFFTFQFYQIALSFIFSFVIIHCNLLKYIAVPD